MAADYSYVSLNRVPKLVITIGSLSHQRFLLNQVRFALGQDPSFQY